MGIVLARRVSTRPHITKVAVIGLAIGILSLTSIIGAVPAESQGVSGAVTVAKAEAGQPTSGSFTFTLDGPNAFHGEETTNADGNGSTLTFSDLEPGAYTLCELVPPGYDADLTTDPPADGKECVNFTVDPGETEPFAVDNTPCPDGGEITLGRTVPGGTPRPATFTYTVTGPPSSSFSTQAALSFQTGDPTTKSVAIQTPDELVGEFVIHEDSRPERFPPFPDQTVHVRPPCMTQIHMVSSGPVPTTVRVVKTETSGAFGTRRAKGRWTFTLTGGSQSVARTKTTNTNGDKYRLLFNNLDPGEYTLCERFTGWRSSLGRGSQSAFVQPNGDRCVNFALEEGQNKTFRVNNRCPLS